MSQTSSSHNTTPGQVKEAGISFPPCSYPQTLECAEGEIGDINAPPTKTTPPAREVSGSAEWPGGNGD